MGTDPSDLHPIELIHDRTRNALHLRVRPGEGRECFASALLDIGEAGRLLGVEVTRGTTFYLPIESGGEQSTQTRTAVVTVGVVLDDRDQVVEVIVPRHGTGYEITYPSGNR